MIRFNETTGVDAYCATVATTWQELDQLIGGLGMTSQAETGRGLHAYEASRIHTDGEGSQIARILYGGRNGNPHVQSYGGHAAAVMEALRREFPDRHDLSRIDIARDTITDFDAVNGVLLGIAADKGVSTPCAGEWHQEPKSRTQYFGAPASRVRVRFYEKGAQLIKAFRAQPQVAEAIPPAWCRLEAQIRPDHVVVKRYLSREDPDALWGSTPLLVAFMGHLFGESPSRVSLQPPQILPGLGTPMDRMTRQYRAYLRRRIRNEGRAAVVADFSRCLDLL